jgi:hypothetical protein
MKKENKTKLKENSARKSVLQGQIMGNCFEVVCKSWLPFMTINYILKTCRWEASCSAF